MEPIFKSKIEEGSNMKDERDIKEPMTGVVAGTECPKVDDFVNSSWESEKQDTTEDDMSSTKEKQPENPDTTKQITKPKRCSSMPKNAWGNSSYADLITNAIMSSPNKRMTVQEIYKWISSNIPYFMDKKDGPTTTGWKNSVRHTLSIRKRFVRIHNAEFGSSNYKSHWTIDPYAETHRRSRVPRQPAQSSMNHVEHLNIQPRSQEASTNLIDEAPKIEVIRSFCPYCDYYRSFQGSYQQDSGYYGYHF